MIGEDPAGNPVVYVPQPILAFCELTAPLTVPFRRASGFQEIEGQRRGSGDLTDLVGSLTIHHLLMRAGKVVSVDITCGRGDTKDLEIGIGGQATPWNVKTSEYLPYRPRLNLVVKEEELTKPMHGYIQAMVHLHEEAQPAHLHILGFLEVGSETWQRHSRRLVPIPRTAHRGMMIPEEELRRFSELLDIADRKF